MLEHYPDILTVKEVKEILFLGKNKIYELIDNGKLSAFKVGRDWRIIKSDLLDFINTK